MKKKPSKKVTKKVVKKIAQKPTTSPPHYEFSNPLARAKVLEYVNASFNMAQSCLENGSEYSHKCMEIQNTSRDVAKALGFKQEHWYGAFK